MIVSFINSQKELGIDVKIGAPSNHLLLEVVVCGVITGTRHMSDIELIYDDKISTASVLISAPAFWCPPSTFLAAFRFLALTTSGILMSSFRIIETPVAVAKLLHPTPSLLDSRN